MQSQNDIEQIWVAAYGIAMAMIVLGATVRGSDEPGTVDAMDENAKRVADRVTKTIEERAALATAKGKRQ